MKKNVLKQGFTLVEIMIVVAIIGILAAVAIPNFLKSRKRSQANACIANMKQIFGAAEQYRLEESAEPENIAALCGDDGFIKGSEPKCPAGGDYELTDTTVTCDYEADEDYKHELP